MADSLSLGWGTPYFTVPLSLGPPHKGACLLQHSLSALASSSGQQTLGGGHLSWPVQTRLRQELQAGGLCPLVAKRLTAGWAQIRPAQLSSTLVPKPSPRAEREDSSTPGHKSVPK